MKFRAMPLAGLTLVESHQVRDDRGEFGRLFCETDYAALRPNLHWVQINLSRTFRRGTVRGLHFQHPPFAEAKLIRCLRGRVFDVALDLRADSPTFSRWHGVELADDVPAQIFIPEGFAHGFQALTDDVQLLYLHTVPWRADHEGCFHHQDPAFAIHWPLPPVHVSEKDRAAPMMAEDFAGLRT